jgi:quinol monooxygenase YgiN
MKVGYKTRIENQFQSLELSGDESSPILVSVSQKKDNNMDDKFLVWHIEGGLGKNIAATALIPSISKKYKSRKLIIVASYPEVFLNHPDVYRVYRVGFTAYFYDNYILGKDTLVFRHEPYFQTGHILKKKHLIENWADILNVDYEKQKPRLYMNMVQQQLSGVWFREKPILLIQTNGGPLQNQNLNYTWTRDLPIEMAIYITEKYSNDYHIIQVTREGGIKIPNVETIDYPMTNMELAGLVMVSSKRILIDSSIQHIAAALELPSVVFWVGTSPENFGYDLHRNIKALPPKGDTKLIDSYLFDYSFEGNLHECPYTNVNEIFNMEEVDRTLNEYL